MKVFRKIKSIEKGFTLIELLIVIVILGILAGIAVPRLMGLRDRAEDAAISAVAGTIRTAMDVLYVESDHGYPNTTEIGDWNDLYGLIEDIADITNNPGDYNVVSIDYTGIDSDTDGINEAFILKFTSDSSGNTYTLDEKKFE